MSPVSIWNKNATNNTDRLLKDFSSLFEIKVHQITVLVTLKYNE
jgi:hypothetical protein